MFERMILDSVDLLYALDTRFSVPFQSIVFEVRQFVVRNEDVELHEDVLLMKKIKSFNQINRRSHRIIRTSAKKGLSVKKTIAKTNTLVSYHQILNHEIL